MIAQRISSLREVAGAACDQRQFSHALRDFLDGFYAAPDVNKLLDEPKCLDASLKDDGLADAYLAAVCEHLCRRHRFPCPAWIKDPRRVLARPHFAAKTHELRMIYLEESPTAFRKRNLFVSANALSRA